MASSRIFVRGLPPSLGESDFRRHFSQQHGATDAKLFPHRRIGYVGYKTADEAAKAVKYFNKSFINMSRIYVELARPTSEVSNRRSTTRERNGPETPVVEENKPHESSRSLKRKRGSPAPVQADGKLAEYLDLMGKKGADAARAIEHPDILTGLGSDAVDAQSKAKPSGHKSEEESDTEYQSLSKSTKQGKVSRRTEVEPQTGPPDPGPKTLTAEKEVGVTENTQTTEDGTSVTTSGNPMSDADWLRSRTSRLLGLLDEEEEDEVVQAHVESEDSHKRDALPVGDVPDSEAGESSPDDVVPDAMAVDKDETTDEAVILERKRLFLRNLAFDATEDDLRSHFSQYGDLDEVHIPVDTRKGSTKGVAYMQFVNGHSAVAAYRACDGQTFQGRLLHILPAEAKRENKLDEYAISKLPLKKQRQIRKRADAATTSFSWNSLYMNADAVMSSVADRLGVTKAALLDPTSADAAVKQALAETHVLQETKAYFLENDVDLEAFKWSTKGDTAILIKNFSYGTKADELRKLLEEHGPITRFLMPPAGTIAIVEFAQPAHARLAFASLAYRKLKDSVLFLEKAPKNLFTRSAAPTAGDRKVSKTPTSGTELLQSNEAMETLETATLFVKNLNFSTSSGGLAEAFKPLAGFLSARVKTKTDPKRPGETLSMGFGFLEFQTKAQAQAALEAMNGSTLDGHQLAITASRRDLDAAEERRRKDRAKKLAAQKSKLIIKNLPFETSKKDVRALLRQYGQLRTVRLPKKFDHTARGFAFAEFTTPREASNAAEALRNTHLLGRKLVIEFAAEDAEDAEEQIARMQQKVGDQTDKVMLDKLLGTGRQKFRVEEGGEEDRE